VCDIGGRNIVIIFGRSFKDYVLKICLCVFTMLLDKPCAHSSVNTIAEYFFLKNAVYQRQSRKHGFNCQVIFIYFSVGMKMVYRVHVYQRQSQIHGFKGVMNWLFKFYYIVF